MRPFLKCTLFVLIAAIYSGSSHASSIIAYNDPSGQGTQSWTGNMGLTFNVNAPINVTSLGVFNASGSGTITGTINVVIYNNSGVAVTPVESFHGTYTPGGLGYDVFQAITPVLLAPGSYEVDAVGFSSSDMNGNMTTGSSSGPTLNTGGGLLTFTGAAYDSSTILNDPTGCSSGCLAAPSPQNHQFDAGTFTYLAAASPVPEPSSFLLLGTGVLGIVGMIRRKLIS